MTRDVFRRIAMTAAQKMGSPWAFSIALLTVLVWAISGPFFNFSSVWQLYINTGTTVITFLMVFLIQSSQNHDTRALHLKIDELIFSSKASNTFAHLEKASEEELAELEARFQELREQRKSMPPPG